MAPLKSFSELSMKTDKKLPNLKTPVKGKKGTSKFMRMKVHNAPYTSDYKKAMNASVDSADRKPEKYMKPDGKMGIRMVKTDKEIIKKEASVLKPTKPTDIIKHAKTLAKNPRDYIMNKKKYLDKARAKVFRMYPKEEVEEAKSFNYFDSKDAAHAHAKKHGGKVFVNTGKGATKVKGKPVNTHVVIKKEATHDTDSFIGYSHAKRAGMKVKKHSSGVTGDNVTISHPDSKKLQKYVDNHLGGGKVKEEVDVDEALNLAQRMKRSRLMKRMKSRIKIGKQRAMRKMANKKTLEKRSMRQARNAIAKKLTRGIPKKELTFARKKEIEKRLEKPALQQRIKRLAKRMFKDVRKKEVERKKG
jgi:hypothetical protein